MIVDNFVYEKVVLDVIVWVIDNFVIILVV